jgi:hypothetical protein
MRAKCLARPKPGQLHPEARELSWGRTPAGLGRRRCAEAGPLADDRYERGLAAERVVVERRDHGEEDAAGTG